ncbi:MAG: TonB-dependent receptor [Bacteroidales bacterium]|nr:TonB-dependent receptor [Bacteroidales bacterium]
MLLAAILSLLMLVPEADTLLSSAHITAFKERVSLEKVPSPVSVFLPAELKTEGVTTQGRLTAMVPGLLIPDYGASLTSTIYLRGIGSRMENPSVSLYLDGIPIMDKNAYDFDWNGIRFAALMRGPGATLYGRNSMSGTLVLQSMAPSGGKSLSAYAEAGLAETLRAGVTATFGRNVLSASFKHGGGWFMNEYKGAPCDPYDGFSVRWKWEQPEQQSIQWSNTLFASLSKEGGFAYGLYEDDTLHPVSYDSEGSYRRLSVIDGVRLHYRSDNFTIEGSGSLQLLSDDMRMDQDFTPQPVFTLRQAQNSGTGTVEVIVRSESGIWQPSTGLFAFYKRNHMHAPVTFGRAGIETLILDNANRNIPQDIGYLSIPDEQMPIDSDFGISTFGAALFHESVITAGRWRLTAGLRLDYEGGAMAYDCLAALHYRFVPTMKADKPFEVPYRGRVTQSSGLQVLPRVSALVEAADGFFVFGTVSKGYRAGGFNTQIFSDILQNQTMNAMMKDLGVYFDTPSVSVVAENTRYKPETAWNYETGLRYVREKFRAEASVYYMDVRNQQLTVFPPGKSTGRMMTNAGHSRSVGAEAEADWQPGEFHFHTSYAWCDARFVDYNDGNHDYSGNHIPYVPVHTFFASAAWSHPIKNARLNLSTSVRAYGPVFWDESGTLSEPVHIRPEARIALVLPGWEIWLRGENLAGSSGRNFYFKSVGREFFSRERPRNIMLGISINL